MANLLKWIEDEIKNEPVIGVVLADAKHSDLNTRKYNRQPKNKLITWEEAIPWIDYEFFPGYGIPGCHALYVWTETKVICIDQYDGSVQIFVVPRNPIDCTPTMPGG